MGPLQFLISINDLPNCLSHCQRRMYADDTHLTFASNHIDCIGLYLNQDLINISDWLIGNKLALNTSKIELLIGSRQRFKTLELPHLYRLIYGASIKQVSYAMSLGVLIDEILSWNEHIEK